MISYIVPIYNADKYLEQCIKSILGCVNAGDEIILIDDGSTDRSGTICDSFEKEYECVFVEHIKNGGVSRARNRGIQRAQKEYIRFVDSDDEVISCQEKTAADLLVMDAEVVDEHRQRLRKVELNRERSFTPKEILEDITSAEKRCLLHYLWNHLYRRAIIVNNDLWFDENVTLGEDFLFNCAYLTHCAKIEYEPAVCYRYFTRNSNEQSLTKKFHADELERRKKIDSTFLKMFWDVGCSQKSLETAECLIGEITVGSLESVATKGKSVPTGQIKKYMQAFYQAEYYGYLKKYIDTRHKVNTNERIEYALIKRKNCLGLYYYVCIRNWLRNWKNRKKK